MTHTVAGLFDSHRTADLVVEHLVQEYGIPRERVRVFGWDASGAAEARSPQDSDQAASLSDLGLSEEKVRAYAEGLASGAVLVAAQVEGDRVERIVAAYREYAAVDLNTSEAEWRGTSSGGAVDRGHGWFQRTCGQCFRVPDVRTRSDQFVTVTSTSPIVI